MSIYSPTAEERAMKLHEVLVQAIAGKLTWIQAADVLGLSPCTITGAGSGNSESVVFRKFLPVDRRGLRYPAAPTPSPSEVAA